MELNSNNSAKNKINPPKIPNNDVQVEEIDDFRAEILKSKAMIDTADKPVDNSVDNFKRKRGRPSKAEKQAEEAARTAAQAEDLKAMVPAEGLKQILALPFHMAALQTGFSGFQLTDKEADAIIPSMHIVMAKYMPQVQGENLALMAFAGSLFSVGLGKYMAYLKFRGGNGAQEMQAENETEAPAPAVQETYENGIPVISVN